MPRGRRQVAEWVCACVAALRVSCPQSVQPKPGAILSRPVRLYSGILALSYILCSDDQPVQRSPAPLSSGYPVTAGIATTQSSALQTQSCSTWREDSALIGNGGEGDQAAADSRINTRHSPSPPLLHPKFHTPPQPGLETASCFSPLLGSSILHCLWAREGEAPIIPLKAATPSSSHHSNQGWYVEMEGGSPQSWNDNGGSDTAGEIAGVPIRSPGAPSRALQPGLFQEPRWALPA